MPLARRPALALTGQVQSCGPRTAAGFGDRSSCSRRSPAMKVSTSTTDSVPHGGERHHALDAPRPLPQWRPSRPARVPKTAVHASRAPPSALSSRRRECDCAQASSATTARSPLASFGARGIRARSNHPGRRRPGLPGTLRRWSAGATPGPDSGPGSVGRVRGAGGATRPRGDCRVRSCAPFARKPPGWVARGRLLACGKPPSRPSLR